MGSFNRRGGHRSPSPHSLAGLLPLLLQNGQHVPPATAVVRRAVGVIPVARRRTTTHLGPGRLAARDPHTLAVAAGYELALAVDEHEHGVRGRAEEAVARVARAAAVDVVRAHELDPLALVWDLHSLRLGPRVKAAAAGSDEPPDASKVTGHDSSTTGLIHHYQVRSTPSLERHAADSWVVQAKRKL
mgnify:CR=1 FL=1